VTTRDKVTVDGIDSIANFIKFWGETIHYAKHNKWNYRVTLSDGTILEQPVHSGFHEDEDHKLVGKCLDLESAYRQLAVRPSQRHLTVFSLKNPDNGNVEFFVCNALPFGASAAVHGFNRAALALEHIIMREFGVPCAHYFDDFTFVAPAAIAETMINKAKDVLNLLGWSVKADKDLPLAESFPALGVMFDLKKCCDEVPVLVVKNTEDRIKEIRNEIRDRLKTGELSAAQASQLRVRLVFANSQTFGRMGAMAFHYLGRRAHMIGASKKMDAELRWALEWWDTHMSSAKERHIQLTNVRRPLYLFTDGSCEPDAQQACGIKAGYGAVMYDPEDNAYEFFQGEIGAPLNNSHAQWAEETNCWASRNPSMSCR